jgi:hypothetical protein
LHQFIKREVRESDLLVVWKVDGPLVSHDQVPTLLIELAAEPVPLISTAPETV